MRDMFGQDNVSTEGAGTGTPPVSGGGTMTATAAAPVPAATVAALAPPLPAPTAATPTLDQTVAKAVAKANSDAVVASDPHAVHGVVLAANSPKVLGSTGAGAGIGFLLGGPPGALIGAGIGFVSEKWQMFGGGPTGILGNVVAKVKSISKPTGT